MFIFTRSLCKVSIFLVMGFCCYTVVMGKNKLAVTYTFAGAGRFGDCVMIYCKAKYYSIKHEIPLLYKPFTFSDQLKLHEFETRWTQPFDASFQHKKLVTCTRDVSSHESDTLFIVDLFTSLAEVAPVQQHKQLEPVDHWINLFADEIYEKMQQDGYYRSIIKDMLKPNKSFAQPIFPQGCITVAVHVRNGGGFDGEMKSKQIYAGLKRTTQKISSTNYWIADCACPLRFPPLQFYIDQINNLSELVDNYPLYVQIFTDNACPQDILRCFQEHCNGHVIVTLGTGGSWRDRTLEDIYLMSFFDCMIRPCSFFSGVAQLMGDHKLVVRPDDFCWDEQSLFITDTVFRIKDGEVMEAMRVPYEQFSDISLKNAARKALLIRV